ncbi:hypothetical protein [Devosia sp. Root105]|uniref:hypothetical protein n=1 Tax=Devosia sp. Root105 TaxID=1736423 RepID=UPI000700CED4|nr:hypothetical protein [Devosia sp. Root105]KQU99082.1 hypothetical protein ASC68_06760 [Devosia sp. Root105]
MLNIDPEKFVVLLLTSAITTWLALTVTSNQAQRVMLLLVLAGFFLYSGLATTDVWVGAQYIVYYGIFSFSIVFGFWVGLGLFSSIGSAISEFAAPRVESLTSGRFPSYFILFFIALHLLNLVAPEFRLHLLVDPPVPNLRLWFSGRLEGSQSGGNSLLHYITTLSVPFFYLSLFYFRRNAVKLILIVGAITYIKYVDQAYIGRSELFFNAVFIFLVLWTEHRTIRWLLVVAAVCSAPVIVTGFYAYSLLRLGVDLASIDLTDAVARVLDSEFTFLIRAGIPLIDSAQHADLGRYFAWILTLPIPSLLKGGADVARVNYEMSAIVLGRGVSDPGFYVLLPGLLAESIYLFGNTFFFAHAIFVGTAAAFFCRLCERSSNMNTMFIYVVMLFFYSLNRGGISSLLPSVVNEFLLFYLFLGISIYRTKASLWRVLPSQYP